jgi:signal transduction histidine kinase
MKLWRPRSLAGQMALLLGLALLVAQLANFALILNERQKLSLSRNQGPALTTLATAAADYASADPIFRPALLADNSRGGIRLSAGKTSGVADGERDAELEDRVRQALVDGGAGTPHLLATSAPGTERNPSRRDAQILRIAIQQKDGSWLNARLYTPRRDPWLGARLGAATLLLYLLVLGASVWLAARIARPLRDLTRATDLFQGRSAPIDVPERGPSDVRRAIRAFNAMSTRMSALLGEKDTMLGAIGHDLRTPLASVRIRLESMEPADESAAAAATLDEMNRILDNILTLARTGRPRDEARQMDVAALAEALVEDYRDAGAMVTFTGADRTVAAIHPDMLRQALRNLIDNAIKYGGSAAVSVGATADAVAITVSDSGPGIPPEELEQVLAPFYRIEGSRNRATGGTGLGLAIAKSVAEMHGGTLTLAAATPTGLRATISVPRA